MSEPTTLPTHVGLILDGNRRWAKSRNLPTMEGHKQGSEVFREIALAAFDRGIKYLSAYVFSKENWNRAEEEVGYLMSLVMKATEKYLDVFDKADIRIVILGRREGLDKKVLASIERTEQKTKDNTRGTLALCFNYGGHEEIVDAVRHMVGQGVKAEDITPEAIARSLYVPDIPPVDFLIRTSGEQRLSGFMLYRAAYAELFFVDKFWPDFTATDLDTALEEFATRQRRFGG